eukprot:TRINITY_DN4856_c0_g1_i2.p1 TRINITY_DN4856_c0_g1~~TRINITY_DN4856_c0_g1_i2.p1  ORF type:complete len:596 (+),score=176.38 TRINITY_DN4856_c0_g1_i2:159-1946(+)
MTAPRTARRPTGDVYHSETSAPPSARQHRMRPQPPTSSAPRPKPSSSTPRSTGSASRALRPFVLTPLPTSRSGFSGASSVGSVLPSDPTAAALRRMLLRKELSRDVTEAEAAPHQLEGRLQYLNGVMVVEPGTQAKSLHGTTGKRAPAHYYPLFSPKQAEQEQCTLAQWVRSLGVQLSKQEADALASSGGELCSAARFQQLLTEAGFRQDVPHAGIVQMARQPAPERTARLAILRGGAQASMATLLQPARHGIVHTEVEDRGHRRKRYQARLEKIAEHQHQHQESAEHKTAAAAVPRKRLGAAPQGSQGLLQKLHVTQPGLSVLDPGEAAHQHHLKALGGRIGRWEKYCSTARGQGERKDEALLKGYRQQQQRWQQRVALDEQHRGRQLPLHERAPSQAAAPQQGKAQAQHEEHLGRVQEHQEQQQQGRLAATQQLVQQYQAGVQQSQEQHDNAPQRQHIPEPTELTPQARAEAQAQYRQALQAQMGPQPAPRPQKSAGHPEPTLRPHNQPQPQPVPRRGSLPAAGKAAYVQEQGGQGSPEGTGAMVDPPWGVQDECKYSSTLIPWTQQQQQGIGGIHSKHPLTPQGLPPMAKLV